MQIVWDSSHEFVRFEGGDASQVGEWAVGTGPEPEATAAVIMTGLDKLDEPVWIHPVTAEELARVGLLVPWTHERRGPQLTTWFDGLKVYLYHGPF